MDLNKVKEHKELNIAIKAVQRAGKILKDNFAGKYRVIRKSPKEMVSEIDLKAQEVILKTLREYNSEYGIITEEKINFEVGKGIKWIIDPLDGTHNYIAGLPFSGVSIGLADDDRFLLGVIFFPMENRLYYGVQGEGAFVNGQPIRVSENPKLSKAIVNFDNQFYHSEQSFDYYKILTERVFTTRILGTATNDLCMTASGIIDGRIWLNTKIVDIAAGVVIITEAGGKITNFDGTPCGMNSKQVVASNGKIHDELLNIFKGFEI